VKQEIISGNLGILLFHKTRLMQYISVMIYMQNMLAVLQTS